MTDKTIASRPTPWQQVLLLCGKCARKMDGGYGPEGEDSLRSTLRQALREQGRRREVRIIETRCLGVCPKKSVAALNAGRPDALLVLPAGTGAAEALAALKV